MDSPPDRPTLDLSAWPSPPPLPLPSRPVRRAPVWRSRRALVAAAGVAAVLLLTGAAVRAGGARPQPVGCGEVRLRFGADVQAADQRAVEGARAALARASTPPPAPPTPRPQPVRNVARAVRGPSAGELRAAQAAVDDARRQVVSAQDEYDRVVAEQQQAADPGLYDEQVAAAEEALAVARERVAADLRALNRLRAQAQRAVAAAVTFVTPPAGVTRPSVRAAPGRSVPERSVLQRRLADAQATQAAHLTARRADLARARQRGCSAR